MTNLTDVERNSLERIRAGEPPALPESPEDESGWIEFGLGLVLEASRMIRRRRRERDSVGAELKADGSPHTRLELDIEAMVRSQIKRLSFSAEVVGEETGGAFPDKGSAVAVDPIDGTWSFLKETETHATSLGVFRDAEPIAGLISNPVTGEVAYAALNHDARIIQLALFDEPDSAHTLPVAGSSADAVLVNLHPSRSAQQELNALFTAWSQGQIRMVRSPGGSPAWALVEAAKGYFVYANAWSKNPADPWDLAAAGLILRRAGGDLVDASGSPIPLLGHSGLFIAGTNPHALETVRRLIQSSAS